MSGFSLLNNVMTAFSASEEWIYGFEIFQSLEEQQLLPEIASCLSIKALLAVHDLEDNYTLQLRQNAEHMAPIKGDLPFLRHRNTVIGASDIVKFMKENDYELNNEETPEQDVITSGVLSLISMKLVPLELYVTWCVERNISKTNERYGYDKAEPLRKILCCQKRQAVMKFLKLLGWLDKSEAELIAETKEVFDFLHKRLEENQYVAGDSLTEADVFVYGHLQAILESDVDNNILLDTLQNYTRLQKFCLNFTQLHLGQQAMLFSL